MTDKEKELINKMVDAMNKIARNHVYQTRQNEIQMKSRASGGDNGWGKITAGDLAASMRDEIRVLMSGIQEANELFIEYHTTKKNEHDAEIASMEYLK